MLKKKFPLNDTDSINDIDDINNIEDMNDIKDINNSIKDENAFGTLSNLNALNKLLGFIIIILLWSAASYLLRLSFLPSPIDVVINTCNIFIDRILIHTAYSIYRILAGTAISIILGTVIGYIMGFNKVADKLLSPVLYLTYPIPKLALLPIIMLFFGLGDVSKIVVIVLIVIFQVIVASRDAVKNIPPETFHSLYSLGASNIDIFKKVIIPASLPGLFSSLRVSFGTAFSVLFFAETFGAQYGLGYFIMDSWMRVNYLDMYSGILVLSLCGFILFLLADKLEKIKVKKHSSLR